MKSKIFNITILILMLFVTTISLKGSEATHSSGKRVHLINLYESPVLVPALLQGKKVTRIHYNGEDDYSEYGIKFVVHRDRIKLKLESNVSIFTDIKILYQKIEYFSISFSYIYLKLIF